MTRNYDVKQNYSEERKKEINAINQRLKKYGVKTPLVFNE